MLDQQVIEQHLFTMEDALANLARYENVSIEQLEKDLSLVWIVERGLQILIQNVLDIGAHILAADIRNDWDDYGEIILKLGQHGIIPKDFSEHIQDMAGLRNILVHEYIKVDVGKLHGFLSHLEDFVEFMSHIQKYVEKLSS
jgi:uncharacterized protein YutE (UPF0331/DUF86 family)